MFIYNYLIQIYIDNESTFESELTRDLNNEPPKDLTNQPKNWSEGFKCELCDRCYSSTNALKEHKQRVHQKLRRYQCEFCSHKAFKKSELARHLKTHRRNKSESNKLGHNGDFDYSLDSDQVTKKLLWVLKIYYDKK